MVKLAVVGAGIGGCSAAYFAHKYLPGSKVTVYEKGKRVGGRIYTFNNKGTKIELGAEFFNSNNRIVSGLVKEMGLEAKKLEEANCSLERKRDCLQVKSYNVLYYVEAAWKIQAERSKATSENKRSRRKSKATL